MTSKQTILEQYDTDELKDIFTSSWRTNDDWETVSHEMDDYDEGNVGYTKVMRHKPSDRFFQNGYWTNSWADYDSEFNVEDIVEVKPVQVTVTQYEPV